jgi:hypothetical protein
MRQSRLLKDEIYDNYNSVVTEDSQYDGLSSSKKALIIDTFNESSMNMNEFNSRYVTPKQLSVTSAEKKAKNNSKP